MQLLLWNSSMCQNKLCLYRHFCAPRKHTHTFNGFFTGSTRVSRYQKGKTNLGLTEARVSEWQWHQLGHMQVCISLQTDNHASTPPLSFLQARCCSCRPTNSVNNAHGNVVDNAVECWGELQRLLPNLNALVAASKGIRAVKLCIDKILQFLTGGAG